MMLALLTVVGEGIEAAFKLFELSHSLGDIDSTYTYAQLLRSGQYIGLYQPSRAIYLLSPGQGCQSDPAKAAELFTDLSMQAHPYAQVHSSYCYCYCYYCVCVVS